MSGYILYFSKQFSSGGGVSLLSTALLCNSSCDTECAVKNDVKPGDHNAATTVAVSDELLPAFSLHIFQAQEALRRAKFKFPGRQKIIVSRKW